MSSRAQGLRLRSPQRRSSPPAKIVSAPLRHRDPAMRAEAYRCGATLEIVALLVDLLDDLPEPVAMEAAVALARMSKQESPTAAPGLIRTAPDSRWDRPFAC